MTFKPTGKVFNESKKIDVNEDIDNQGLNELVTDVAEALVDAAHLPGADKKKQ